MKRAVINLLNGDYVNIPADKLVQDGDYLYVYAGEDNLMAMVKWDMIAIAKISEREDRYGA